MKVTRQSQKIFIFFRISICYEIFRPEWQSSCSTQYIQCILNTDKNQNLFVIDGLFQYII